MKTGWLKTAGPFKVEHVPFEDAGPLLADAYRVRRGGQHTTEGSTIEGALSAYRAKRCAPTFTVGLDAKHKPRILQHVPLGHAARAFENAPGGVDTNRVCIAQIELVGVSPIGRIWLPARPVADRLAALYATLNQACEIPLLHVANPKRSGKVWESKAGWYGHVDLPENHHVDPRSLDYRALFDLATELEPGVRVKAKPRKKLPVGKTTRLGRRSKKAAPAPLCVVGENARAAQPITTAASTNAGSVSTVVVTTGQPKPKPKPRPKKKNAPKTRYYTLKRNVPLKRGQVIGYQPKRGYYARAKKKA